MNIEKYFRIGLLFSFLLCTSTTYTILTSARWFSDQIMRDIFNFEIESIKTFEGKIFNDNKHRETYVLIEHIVITSLKRECNPKEDFLYYRPLLFDPPEGIVNYRYVSRLSDPDNVLMSSADISHKYYTENKYLEQFYSNYENFKTDKLNSYSTYPGFEYNEADSVVFYGKIVPEKRFTYRVKTISDIEKVTVCLYKINQEWRLGAIFRREPLSPVWSKL